jgi:hypothetical protein
MERMMPPFAGSLDEAARRDLAAAVQALSVGPEAMVRGRVAFRAACADCHAGSGGSQSTRLVDGDEWTSAAVAFAQHANAAGTRASLDDPTVHPPIDSAVVDAALGYLLSAAYDPVPTDGLSVGNRIGGRVEHVPSGRAVPAAVVSAQSRVSTLPGSLMTTTTAPDGTFAFADVLAGRGVLTELSVVHEGVTYTSVITPAAPPASGAEGSETPPVTLPVYDTTTEAELVAERVQLLLSPDPSVGVLRAAEIWSVRNEDLATLVANGVPPLVFRVPPGAANPRLVVGGPVDPGGIAAGAAYAGEGHRRTLTATISADGLLPADVPIPPGGTRLSFEYEMPYSEVEFDWPVRPAIPAEDVRVAMVAEGVTLEAAGRESIAGEVGGASVAGLQLGAVGPADNVVVSIRGLPQPQAAIGATGEMAPGWTAWVGLAVGALGMIAALTFAYWGEAPAEARRAARLRAARREAIDRIATLDRSQSAASAQPGDAAIRAALIEEAVRLDEAILDARRTAVRASTSHNGDDQ